MQQSATKHKNWFYSSLSKCFNLFSLTVLIWGKGTSCMEPILFNRHINEITCVFLETFKQILFGTVGSVGKMLFYTTPNLPNPNPNPILQSLWTTKSTRIQRCFHYLVTITTVAYETSVAICFQLLTKKPRWCIQALSHAMSWIRCHHYPVSTQDTLPPQRWTTWTTLRTCSCSNLFITHHV